MTEGMNRAEALYQHILSLERLQEAKDEAGADFNERKKLVKEDGFDTNVVAAILKRRKNGQGQTVAFDQLLAEYEDMLEDRRDAHDTGMERMPGVVTSGDFERDLQARMPEGVTVSVRPGQGAFGREVGERIANAFSQPSPDAGSDPDDQPETIQ